jgi:hypothetical protein
MNKLLVLPLGCLMFVGCGGGNSNSGTSLAGNWSITAMESGTPNSVMQTTLVSSACSVSTPIGSFTVQGPACFIADNNTGQGSITTTSGTFLYPPQGVLIGAQSNPTAANTSQAIDLLFVEADSSGDVAVFNGTGTISSGSISGTWSCNANSPSCTGLSGTFSGTQ